jgi:hypothetical protein
VVTHNGVLGSFSFMVLGFELWACQAGALPALFVMSIFKMGSLKLFAWLTSNHDPPGLCLPSN